MKAEAVLEVKNNALHDLAASIAFYVTSRFDVKVRAGGTKPQEVIVVTKGYTTVMVRLPLTDIRFVYVFLQVKKFRLRRNGDIFLYNYFCTLVKDNNFKKEIVMNELMKLPFAITEKGILGNGEPARQDRHYTLSPGGLYLPITTPILPSPGGPYHAVNLDLNSINTRRV
jgi:hypothetical protein